MKKNSRFITASILAVAMAAALPVVADTQVISHPTREYVYYRDHEIYFRPETKVYYWKENGNWQSGSVLPTHSRSYVTTGGVSISLDTERPYEQHESVMTKYTSTNRQGDTTTTEKTVHPDGSSSSVSTTTKQRYVYYRDHDIYFAPERKTYYWRADGRWQSGAQLPLASRTFVSNGGVSIELDTDRPYTQHDNVVKRYKVKHSVHDE